MAQLKQGIAQVQGINDQIATAAEQQSSVAEEINQRMHTTSARSESRAGKAADGPEASVALTMEEAPVGPATPPVPDR